MQIGLYQPTRPHTLPNSRLPYRAQQQIPVTQGDRFTPSHGGQVLRIRFGKNDQLEASIPVADLKDFLSNDPARVQRFVKTAGDGLRDVGFIALKNHGIPKPLFEKHYKALDGLFALPKAMLEQYAFIKTDGLERGYLPPGELKPYKQPDGSIKMLPDRKENWITGIDNNVYPAQAPDVAKQNVKLFRQFEKISMHLVKALSQYFEDKDGVLEKMSMNAKGKSVGTSVMRSIRYPEASAEELKMLEAEGKIVRAGAHRDISFFTLLPQSTVSGLQLLKKGQNPDHDDSWVDVFAQQGMIIVNAGDSLMHMTKGMKNSQGESREIASTPHRVVGKQESASKVRYTTPFFFNVNLKGPIQRIDTKELVRVVDPQKGIDVTLDEGAKFLYERFKKSGTIGADVTYEAFRERYTNVGPELRKLVKAKNLDAIIKK